MAQPSPTPRARRKRARLGWWVIVPVALLVRAVYLFEISDLPSFDRPMGDGRAYIEWAARIAGGDWIGTEPFYQAPFYPYFLAVVFRLLGVHTLAVLVVQAVAGSLAALWIAWAAGTALGRRVGWVAGLGYALYPPAIFFDGLVQKASVSAALTCLMLTLLLVSPRRLTGRRLAATGVVLGLLALTRENAFVWLGVVCAYLGVLGRRTPAAAGRRLARCGWMLGGAAAVLALVAARNAHVSGELSLSTFQMGPNFHIGNGAGADGRYRPLVRGHETPEFERADATMLAQQALGRTLTAGEVSAYWWGRAWNEIRADPGRWLKLMGAKLLMTLNAYEVSDVDSFRVHADASRLLGGLRRVWHFGVLAPLAAAGAVLARRRKRPLGLSAALALSLWLAVAAFFVLARYRFPLVPVLMPWAAAGLVRAWTALRQGRGRRLIPALTAAAATGLAVNGIRVHPEHALDAMAYSNLGVAYALQARLDDAVKCFTLAVRGNPGSAEAHYNLGLALAGTGRLREAVDQFRAASLADPELIEVDYQCGAALEALGRREEAAMRYRRALDIYPDDTRAREALERLAREAAGPGRPAGPPPGP